MAATTEFLEKKLKLKVSADKQRCEIQGHEHKKAKSRHAKTGCIFSHNSKERAAPGHSKPGIHVREMKNLSQ